jgi:type III secretion protein D
MSGGLLLGVFTGNHAGAEALFEAGEYVVGAALDCDVALTDSTLAPRHCSFFLAEDGAVRLTPLEGTLTLHGKTLSGPLDWPARLPVLAGMICLAWTRPGEGWANMKLPALLAAEENPAEAGAESPAARTEAGTEETKTGTTGAASANRGRAEEDPARPAAKRFGRLPRLAVLGVVVLGLGGLTLNLSLPGGADPHRLDRLEGLLADEGFSDLRVDENAGRAIIYGLVPTQVDANKVRGLAAGQPYPVQVIVREREEFSRAILGALAEKGLFPQMRIEDGEAVLLGYVLDGLTENAALSWARSAAPRVAPVRSALLTRGAVEATLAAELAKAGLAGKVSVDWRPGVIVLNGPNGETADKNALAGVMGAVRGALDSPIAFQLAGAAQQERIYVGEASGEAAGAAGPEALPNGNQAGAPAGRNNPFGEGLSLRSVTPASEGGSGLPFITTSDGAVYFLGGALPGGQTLTGIYADRLEFSRNGSNMAYKLQGR